MKQLNQYESKLYLIVMFVIGSAIIIMMSIYSFGLENKKVETGFKIKAEIRAFNIEEAIHSHIRIIEQISSFYNASQEVTREKFKIFVSGHLKEMPSIQALEWIPLVTEAHREEVERKARKFGFKDFQITEREAQGKIVRAGNRYEYFPVYFIEPMKGNEAALGFDLASNPRRLEALDKARYSRKTVATAQIKLVQEEGSQAGFLVFSPVFNLNKEIGNDLIGFALGVFRVGDLVSKSLANVETSDPGIDFYLFDVTNEDQVEFLNYYSSSNEKINGSTPNFKKLQNDIHIYKQWEVAGRQWALIALPNEKYLMAHKGALPWIVFLFGFGVLFILMKYFISSFIYTKKISLLADELALINEVLEESLEHEQELSLLKTNFVSMASHEFRTPLTAISATSDIILNYSDKMTQDEINLRLEKIKHEVGGMVTMLEDVLIIGKSDAQKLEYNPDLLDIVSLVKDIITEYKLSDSDNRTVVYHLSSDVIMAKVDKKWIKNIVINLISNAIKYSDKDTDVEVSINEDQAGVSLSVKDYGIGISQEDIKRLFEPFYRASNVGDIPGTGLGLVVVQKSIELHKGKIEIESEVDKGSRFIVTLPHV
jgi:signal transduction histidine kinase